MRTDDIEELKKFMFGMGNPSRNYKPQVRQSIILKREIRAKLSLFREALKGIDENGKQKLSEKDRKILTDSFFVIRRVKNSVTGEKEPMIIKVVLPETSTVFMGISRIGKTYLLETVKEYYKYVVDRLNLLIMRNHANVNDDRRRLWFRKLTEMISRYGYWYMTETDVKTAAENREINVLIKKLNERRLIMIDEIFYESNWKFSDTTLLASDILAGYKTFYDFLSKAVHPRVYVDEYGLEKKVPGVVVIATTNNTPSRYIDKDIIKNRMYEIFQNKIILDGKK